MKTRLVFSTHSTVDLITNSSSEIFIFNTDKTLKAFRAALVDLFILFSKTSYGTTFPSKREAEDQMYNTILNKPTVNYIKFNYDAYPNLAKYEETTYDAVEDHPLKEECNRKQMQFGSLNSKLLHKRMTNLDKYYIQYHALSTPWKSYQNKARQEFIDWGIAQNSHLNLELEKLTNEISSAISSRYSLNPGDIIIDSVSNSGFPSEFDELLSANLPFTRIRTS